MILAIDMGNSNIVIGGIDEKRIYFMERLSTDKKKTDLEYAVSIRSVLELSHVDAGQLEGAILSSVVPPLNPTITAAVKKVTGLTLMIVGSGMKTGLNIRMDDPKKVGADLIVDSVAAKALFPLPIIVIDMGTATTVTAVDKNGDYIGGAICPGLRVSLDAIASRTAQLPYIELDEPSSVIGKNTVDSMRSGIMYGNAAMIDGLIDRMEEELGEKASIVATGGIAPFVCRLCRHEITVDDAILLRGLLILYRKNR